MTNKEAIEVITHFDKHIIPCDEYGYRIDSDLMEAHLMAAKALRNGWIPVTERLPEHKSIVLVFIKNGEQDLVQWDCVENLWIGKQWTYKRHAVTHWMPLPTPPEGE